MTNRREGILVTGASSGIGAATACYLAKMGFFVCGTVRHEEDGGYLRAADVLPVVMDVTDAATVASAVEAVETALSGVPLCGLVNNAGIPSAGPLELIPIDCVQNVIDVNVIGSLRVIQACLPHLKRNMGRIVNISSVSARTPLPFIGPYAASKAALEAMTHSLRRELAPFDVGVTIVRPGSVRTRVWDMVEDLDASYLAGTDYELVARRVSRLAVLGGRKGLGPAAVARAVGKVLTCRVSPVSIDVVNSRAATLLTRALPDTMLDWLIMKKVWAQQRGV